MSQQQGPKTMLFDGTNVLGNTQNPVVTTPDGVGVQPVAFVAPQHVIVDSGGGGGGGSNAAAGLTGSPVPTSADYIGFNSGGNLLGVSSGNPLPVVASGTVAVSNFPASFSISNFPATQPVSGTVAVSNFPATQPVSGTVAVSNFPATQPVSGTVAVSNSFALDSTLTGGTQQTKITDGTNVATVKAASTAAVATDKAVVVAVSPNNSVAVTGTFFQGTQPVSLATLPALTAGTAVIGHVIVDAGTAVMGHVIVDSGAITATLNAETTKVIGTVNVAAGQTVAVTQATPANLQATVTQQTLTKGTQGSTGVTTQDLKDAGRVIKTYSASAVTGVTTEALISLTPYADLVAGVAATTFAVTAGKRLRLQTIVLTWRNNTAAAGGVTIRLRTNAGTVLVTSPVQGSLNATTSLATIGSGASATMIIPDGMELSGTMQFGLTQLAVTAVVGFDIHVIGYEY